MKQIAKIALGIVLGFVLLMGGCSLLFTAGSNDNTVSDNSTVPNNTSSDDSTPSNNNGEIEWKGYQFTKDDYKIALYNDDCMVLVKDMKTVGNTVKIKYSFYNESGNDDTPGYTLCSTLYQDGISNEDIEFGSEHGNEYNSIRSGHSVDDCYEYVTFDPSGSKDVEIDLSLFLSTECTVLYNVDTEEFSIK